MSEAAGFLFETIPGTLERSILHKVVDGVGTVLGGADTGDVRKEAVEVFEKDGGRIEGSVEEVGEGGGSR